MAVDVDQIEWAYAADIVKSEETADGHLMVYGKAANPTLDLDGQIADPDWLAREMPDWFNWGNIRAQHGPVAAGVGKTLEADGKHGFDLASLIVDTDAKEKVRTGVYKGYSIGIKNARVIKDAAAPNGRIVGGKIVEISLVDRPCNPDSKMTLLKSAGSISNFEDPGDPQSPVVEEEILAPTSADGELVEPDEADDELDADLPDLVKGFIEFLRGPKPKKAKTHGSDSHKRDQGGRFARQEARLKDREGKLSKREQALKDRQADVTRTIMENALSREALADAEQARLHGRTGEAQEHQAVAASHAHDRGYRARAAIASRRIGKAAQVDEMPEVTGWDDMSDDALEFVIHKAARVLGQRCDSAQEAAEIVKGLMPDTVKRFFSADARRDAVGEGDAMPGGRFPIENQGDLDNAVHLIGQADDQDAVRSHIRAMAKKHGLKLPESMESGPDDDGDADDVSKAAGADGRITSIISAEITKALKAQQEAHEAELAALRAKLATVEEKLTKTAAPDAMAPVAVIQTNLRPAPQAEAEADRLRREATTRMTDLHAQRAVLAYADRLGGGH